MRAFLSLIGLAGAVIAAPLALAHADQVGHASWYALHSRTASGEMMNPNAMTAAHRSLPFGTKVRVENLSNGRSVVVRINDRGPFVHGRVIDVSKAAAANLGMIGSGTAQVRISTSGRAVSQASSKSESKRVVRGHMAQVAKSGHRTKEAFKSTSKSTKRGGTVTEASDKKQYGIFAGGLFGGKKDEKADRRSVARN
ncbi:septal ring lytic transglycosylase RlpA family protein [Methyloligella solikamskensis]|uniref:Endolytic peptidoglycan transglycosylase RlpA n=1 Tax=Methyloligella solikamskensis TaxID=1177756 RepID=A0ABW3J8B5_9HYPH